jgi:hypothetical protein
MSELGQKRKGSNRAFRVRFAPDSGGRADIPDRQLGAIGRHSRVQLADFEVGGRHRPAEKFAAIRLASFRNRKKIDPPVSRITLDRNYVRYPLIGCLLVRRRCHIHRVADLGGDLQAQAYKGAARNASITIQSAFTTAHPHINMP